MCNAALFPYIQYTTTIGEAAAGRQVDAAQHSNTQNSRSLWAAVRATQGSSGSLLPASLIVISGLSGFTLKIPACPRLALPLPLYAVGMCNNTGVPGDNWGSKCTIDAKRLWKIFYITPGEQGGPGGNLQVGAGRLLD